MAVLIRHSPWQARPVGTWPQVDAGMSRPACPDWNTLIAAMEREAVLKRRDG